MPIPILMPALSPTMEEGTLAKWHVKVGDTVSAGDVLAEIETDKATMEVEAVDEGTVGKLLVEEGTEGVKVNAPIAILLEEGEDDSALEGYDPGSDAPAAPPVKESAKEPSKEPARSEKAGAAEAAPAQKADKSTAPAKSVSDKGGKAPPAPETADGERVFASPLARRLASQEGIDLTQLSGSGPHGRIVRRDIGTALKKGTGKDAPAAVGMARGEERREKHPTIRKTIARRMVEAKQTAPHFYLTVDFEIDALLAARVQLNEGAQDYKVSVNDLVVKACALALRDMPSVNASFTESEMIYHGAVDVSVAVATERGLMVPIIRNADLKGLREISSETKALATKAREGKLMPEEYQGGGFSVSNLGMYGIREFAAIINPPQSAILAVGAGEERPVVRDGELAIATMMSCTLSVDHRAVDGAMGAEFLQVLRRYIEKPATMLL